MLVVCLLGSSSLKDSCHSLEYSAQLLLFDGICLWPQLAGLMLLFSAQSVRNSKIYLYEYESMMMSELKPR